MILAEARRKPWRQTRPVIPGIICNRCWRGGDMSDPIRLSKLMSERGLCSRREADSYIERGLVFVDGRRISELGTKVDPDCAIRLDREASAQQQQRVTILLHKPIGYVSGQPEPGYQPAVVLIRPETQWQDGHVGPAFSREHLKGLAPAGRLDIDSTGLLVLTQDGRIAKQLIGDDSDVEKEYLVRVRGHWMMRICAAQSWPVARWQKAASRQSDLAKCRPAAFYPERRPQAADPPHVRTGRAECVGLKRVRIAGCAWVICRWASGVICARTNSFNRQAIGKSETSACIGMAFKLLIHGASCPKG